MSIERYKDDRGHGYVVRFPSEIRLEGSSNAAHTVWFKTKYAADPKDASRAAWEWFKEVTRRYARQHVDLASAGLPNGFGPLGGREPDGKFYHGRKGHAFTVLKHWFGDG